MSGDNLYFVGPTLDVEWEQTYLKLKNYGLNVGGVVPATKKLTFFPDARLLKQDGYGRRFENDGYIFETGFKLNSYGASLFFNPIAKHFEHDRDEAETFDR